MKLLIISHTSHYQRSNEIVGFSPTISEINYLSKYFDSIIHLAVLHPNIKGPRSAIKYNSDNIKFVPIKPFGGSTILKKINVIFRSITLLFTLKKYLKQVDIFQFRAPTSIGVFLIPYLIWFTNKKGWFKYAGNWNQKNAPYSYKFQKSLLINNKINKVTINGFWEKQPEHCLSFENPCLYKEDRLIGQKIIQKKEFSRPWNICFAGALNDDKGIPIILNALEKFSKKNLIEAVHFVGDGDKKNQYKIKADKLNMNIIFHGNLERSSLFEIYKKCHFLLLPTKSEGFPKVVAEAANFGCLSIVTSTSAIPHYIKHDYNGFLWKPNNISFELLFENILTKTKTNDLNSFKLNAYKFAEDFTYDNYLDNIIEKIIHPELN